MNVHVSDTGPAQRRPPRPSGNRYGWAVLLLGICSNLLLGGSLVELMQPAGALDTFKIALLTAAGAIVTVTVNRLAIERGTRLLVVGYTGVGLASLGAVVFVGTGLASATFAGLTRGDVDRLALEAHGRALAEATAKAARDAPAVARAAPVVRSVAADLGAKAECERRESCVSGRAGGGRGPVARHLQMLAGRGETIAGEVETELRRVSDGAARTGELVAEYIRVASDASAPAEKRVRLLGIDARIREAFFARGSAAAGSLAEAYLAELRAPVAIPGQPEASRGVAALLRAHADSLGRALDPASRGETVLPAFPAPAGTADTLLYAPRFWPVLVLALVVDVVLPVLLWLSAAATRDWLRHRGAPPPPRPLSADERDTDAILAPPLPRPAIHPAFDPEAYVPPLPRRDRDYRRGGDAR